MNNMTPFENFMGRKIDYKTDLKTYFGQYVQIFAESSNKLEPRTSGAIALLPTHNAKGTITFFDLNTLRVVKRDKYLEVPTSDDIINRLNSLAAKEKTQPQEMELTVGAEKRLLEEEDADENDARERILPPISNEIVHTNQSFETGAADPIYSTPDPPIEEGISNFVVDGDDDDDDDSLYVPSHDGDDINWVPDFLDEELYREEGEDDANAEDATLEDNSEDVLNREEGEDNANSEDATSNEPTDSPQSRLPKRSNRGIHSHFYGFHTHIKKALVEFGDAGIEALKCELLSMIDKKVWQPVKKSTLSTAEQKTIINSLAFLKKKYHPDGSPDRDKARLVAGGHMQDETLYCDTASPTVDINNVFMEAAICALKKRVCATADIGSAYLHAEMEDIIFMRLDKHISKILCTIDNSYCEYVENDGTIVQLLKQSGLLWYRNMRETLSKFNFKPNPYDPCVFSRGEGDDECIILLYVDIREIK
jgi:hypothetical protein